MSQARRVRGHQGRGSQDLFELHDRRCPTPDPGTSQLRFWSQLVRHTRGSFVAWVDRLSRLQTTAALLALSLPPVLSLLGRAPAWLPAILPGAVLAASVYAGVLNTWKQEVVARMALEEKMTRDDLAKKERDDLEALAHRERVATFVADCSIGNTSDVAALLERPETRHLAAHLGTTSWGGAFVEAIRLADATLRHDLALQQRVRTQIAAIPRISRRGTDAVETVTRWIAGSAFEGTAAFHIEQGTDGSFHLYRAGWPGFGYLTERSRWAIRELQRECRRIGAEVLAWNDWQVLREQKKAAAAAWTNVLAGRPDIDTLKTQLRTGECQGCLRSRSGP